MYFNFVILVTDSVLPLHVVNDLTVTVVALLTNRSPLFYRRSVFGGTGGDSIVAGSGGGTGSIFWAVGGDWGSAVGLGGLRRFCGGSSSGRARSVCGGSWCSSQDSCCCRLLARVSWTKESGQGGGIGLRSLSSVEENVFCAAFSVVVRALLPAVVVYLWGEGEFICLRPILHNLGREVSL